MTNSKNIPSINGSQYIIGKHPHIFTLGTLSIQAQSDSKEPPKARDIIQQDPQLLPIATIIGTCEEVQLLHDRIIELEKKVLDLQNGLELKK